LWLCASGCKNNNKKNYINNNYNNNDNSLISKALQGYARLATGHDTLSYMHGKTSLAVIAKTIKGDIT